MTLPSSKMFLCIHGHFYQPPRENAWIEEIEEQESARPFHDWNQRIHAECYRPNTMARVLDGHSKIIDIVNNLEFMSFNFGPTLLSWLEDKHPETYRLILEADRRSSEMREGHGNAIAQAYNHMIMPLANHRDKVTQLKWGKADFKHRFGREPASVWLPETACNEETIEALVEEGVQYIILEPHQAQSIRAIQENHWHEVSSGQIDPKQPYRCFLKKEPTKFIDIFFYDGPISKDIGFGDMLANTKTFMDRVDTARIHSEHSQLIHMATDGETYGHHKVFGDRVLAYLFHIEAAKRGYLVTNYAQYLAHHPPLFAVQLKEGENGEGTSWSCAHGVLRWKDHCGCRGDGPAHWTQHWRKPLRESLDWLRDELSQVFEERGSYYFQDVWAARNDYIEVVLDRSEQSIQNFIGKHGKFALKADEIIAALKLLEMQRNAMLMYTSCGWFFTELSGIETIQILQYAARAIQLCSEVSGRLLEEDFMTRLSEAKSNIPELKDGRGIYEKFVRLQIRTLKNIASLYAIGSTLDGLFGSDDVIPVYAFQIHNQHQHIESYGNLTLNFGKIHVRSRITFEEATFLFVVVQIGLYDFRCSIKSFSDSAEQDRLEKELFEGLRNLHVVELLRKIDGIFGEHYYSLKDLPLRERKWIISILTKETISKISTAHEHLFDENRRMGEIYRSINLPIPSEIRFAAEHTLSKRLMASVVALAEEDFNLKKARSLFRLIESASAFDVRLNTKEANDFLSDQLAIRAKNLLSEVNEREIFACLSITRLAKRLGIDLDITFAQDFCYQLLRKWSEDSDELENLKPEILEQLFLLVQTLGIQTSAYKSRVEALSAKK